MKTVDLFRKKTVLSYEVFPPKQTSQVHRIHETLQELKALSPDFISVTYGAGGGQTDHQTFEIASLIRGYGVEAVAHLSGVGLTREAARIKLAKLKEMGVENILALRGDISSENPLSGSFPYASDLIAFIKSQGDFNVIAACYPQGHRESESKIADMRNLKRKVEAGAEQLITQLFFDNSHFYSFWEHCRLADIHVPIEAGIMPVVNKKQIERITALCGVPIPPKFVKMMERYGDQPEAMQDAGIAYAIDQIIDLTAHGVDGIHLYTMNNPFVAKQIHSAVQSLL